MVKRNGQRAVKGEDVGMASRGRGSSRRGIRQNYDNRNTVKRK